MHPIIERIEHLRAAGGLTRSDFARKMGVAPQTYAQCFQQEDDDPLVKLMSGLADAYPDLSLRWLLTGEGEPPSANALLDAGPEEVAMLSQEDEAELDRVFEELDTDDDGLLTEQDLLQLT